MKQTNLFGYSKEYVLVSIGSNNWFGNGCKIMKRTKLLIIVLFKVERFFPVLFLLLLIAWSEMTVISL